MADNAVTEIYSSESTENVRMGTESQNASDSMLDSLAEVTQSDPEELPLIFQFNWQGIDFTSNLSRTEDGDNSILELHATIGTLPFTAENVSVRNELIERLRHSQFILGREIALNSRSGVELKMKTELARHVFPSEAIKVVSACLLLAKDDLAEIRAILGATTH